MLCLVRRQLTPNIDMTWTNFPWTLVGTLGTTVGWSPLAFLWEACLVSIGFHDISFFGIWWRSLSSLVPRTPPETQLILAYTVLTFLVSRARSPVGPECISWWGWCMFCAEDAVQLLKIYSPNQNSCQHSTHIILRKERWISLDLVGWSCNGIHRAPVNAVQRRLRGACWFNWCSLRFAGYRPYLSRLHVGNTTAILSCLCVPLDGSIPVVNTYR